MRHTKPQFRSQKHNFDSRKGHEQVSTTSIYLHADMSQKERAIARTQPLSASPGRYRAPDHLLAFLEAL